MTSAAATNAALCSCRHSWPESSAEVKAALEGANSVT